MLYSSQSKLFNLPAKYQSENEQFHFYQRPQLLGMLPFLKFIIFEFARLEYSFYMRLEAASRIANFIFDRILCSNISEISCRVIRPIFDG